MVDEEKAESVTPNENLPDDEVSGAQEELSELDVLKSQVDDLKDKLLRAVAETQNIQKRADKEKADISKYSISGFARDVLSIRDNLQLALNNCDAAAEAIISGVKLTMTEMDKILERYGVKIIEAMEKPFDPHVHQAMVEVEVADKEPGIVVQVMQEGFMIHDRLLRPALVGVSKKC
ncbi:MAG: nucleotide exchange factor GrpE [Alphaproteobacteria bacterium]|nr:nucleotide exchange factor GrpE [Alphaproteobacteria bacterium]